MVWMKFKPQCWTQESRHRGSGPILCAHYLRVMPTGWWDLYKIQTQAKRIHAVLGQDSDNLWWVDAEGDLVEADTLWFLLWVLVTWLGSVLENSLNSSFITCALFCMYLTFLKAKLWWFWTVVLMLLNCGVGEDSWESLGHQGDQTSQSKEISPEYSLEGLMLKLKLQYFGHLIRRTDSFEKTLIPGKIEGRRRGGQDGWMASPTQWTWVWASSWRWWRTWKFGTLQSIALQSVRGLRDWTMAIPQTI